MGHVTWECDMAHVTWGSIVSIKVLPINLNVYKIKQYLNDLDDFFDLFSIKISGIGGIGLVQKFFYCTNNWRI